MITGTDPGWSASRVAIAYHSVQGHVGRLARAVAEGVVEIPDARVDPVVLDSVTPTSWEVLDRANANCLRVPAVHGRSLGRLQGVCRTEPSGNGSTTCDAGAKWRPVLRTHRP
jgi:hypothetical protein